MRTANTSARFSGRFSDLFNSGYLKLDRITRLLPILSGFLVGTSYIPFPPWALFFCLVPLMIFWMRAENAKQAFLGGWLTQFLLNLIGFHWIAYTTVEFGHFPWWFGALTLLFFASFAHLHYAFAGLIGHWLSRRFNLGPAAKLFTFAFAFALCDHRFPMIFPWHLGYPWLWGNFPGAQFADVIGFEGLNVLTIFINAFIAGAAIRFFALKKKAAFQWAGIAIGITLALNLAGLGRADKWKQADSQIKALAVQGNIGNFDKLMAERGNQFRDPIVDKYISLSQKGLTEFPEADFLVWPETAFPTVLDEPFLGEHHATRVRNFLREVQKPLFTGAYSLEAGTSATYNGFFFLGPNGLLTQKPYRKSILLAFGETFPFSEYVDYVTKFFPNQGSFGRGQGPIAMNIALPSAGLNIGTQICYEGLYPWFSAGLSRTGAQIFVNATNDSWFGKTFEPYQHLYMTAARAIEFRRPLLRSTNTGITTAVLATGEFLQKSPIDQEWTGLFTIPYMSNPPHTFYENIAGHWGWPLAFGLICLLVFGRVRQNVNGATAQENQAIDSSSTSNKEPTV